MVNTRTEDMIRMYMQWSPSGTLTPEDFLKFRRQAVEEELAGVREAAPPEGGMRISGDAPAPPPRRKAAAKERNTSPAAEKPERQPPEERGKDTVKQDTGKQATGPSGMTEADFLAFMQSVED